MDNMFMYNFDDEKNKVDSDLELKNKALEDIIANQQEEENKIKDNYDSLDSRAGRFLEVLGAGLSGGNAAQVAQNQRDNLNRQLQSAQARYKDQRDSAYNQYKDLLARREALDKSRYDRERDLVKDQQTEREYELKKDQFDKNYELDKTKADREYDIKNRTLELSAQGQNAKNEQNQQEIAEKEKNDRRNNILNTLTTIQQEQKNIIDPDSGTWYSPYTDSEKKSASLVNKLNIDAAMDTFGLSEKEATDFIAKNPEMFGKKSDSWDVLLKKYSNINKEYQPVEEKQINGKDILEVREKIDNNGNPVKIYKLRDNKGNISYHMKQ